MRGRSDLADDRSGVAAKDEAMFTLTLWHDVQDGLLTDPDYVGMRVGPGGGGVQLVWRAAAVRTAAAERAVRRLADAAILADSVVSTQPAVNVEEEMERLQRMDRGRLEIFGMGADEAGVRIELTIARGSFDRLARHGGDVLMELDPQVPVVIDEGERPLLAEGQAVESLIIS